MIEKDKKYLKILQDFGLSEHEARVYFAALRLGPSTVLQLARESGLQRTAIYYILEGLKRHGIISTVAKGFKQLYAAEDPVRLEQLLRERQARFRDLLPELSAFYHMQGGESTVKYYEGLEAIKGIYESMLKDVRPKEDYLVMSDMEQWIALDPDFFNDFRKRRAKLNIRRRLLYVENEVGRRYKKVERNFGEEIRFLPKGTALTTNVVVIPRRIMFHQMTPPMAAVVIESPSIIAMQRQVFDLLWNLVPA